MRDLANHLTKRTLVLQYKSAVSLLPPALRRLRREECSCLVDLRPDGLEPPPDRHLGGAVELTNQPAIIADSKVER